MAHGYICLVAEVTCAFSKLTTCGDLCMNNLSYSKNFEPGLAFTKSLTNFS